MKDQEYYMNPNTGSVAPLSEWEQDFKDDQEKYDIEEWKSEIGFVDGIDKEEDYPELTWEMWGGDELIHVMKNDIGEWVEV